jgi:SOS-response transcriptional repressor LexA
LSNACERCNHRHTAREAFTCKRLKAEAAQNALHTENPYSPDIRLAPSEELEAHAVAVAAERRLGG